MRVLIAFFGVWMLASASALAAIPMTINFQGVVQVADGSPLNGDGLFKFGLYSGSTWVWTNDGTTGDISSNTPTAAVTVTVTDGLYSVVLGDTSVTNMGAIPSDAFDNDDVQLRVWFDDQTNGEELLISGQTITSAAYAFHSLRADSSDNGVPTGSIIPYLGDVAPPGWLLCDGSAASEAAFPELFAVIGTKFGGGLGTFNLPDLRGLFLRGAGQNSDPGRRYSGDDSRDVGDFQDEGTASHTHFLDTGLHGVDTNGGNVFNSFQMGGNQNNPTRTYTTNANSGATDETRPMNLGVNYIIKN